MKKYITFLLCLLIILSLFSCDLNKDQSAPSQNDIISNNTSAEISEAERVMKMYETAIAGEIAVIDSDLGEIKLSDCAFKSDNLRLGDCVSLSKVILDMDGDGINEYFIQSPDKDHIMLRYYNGKVYSYCFDKNNFYNLNTNGSFYWSDPYESENWYHGSNQITFDGSSLIIKEIYRIRHLHSFDFYEELEFYADGKQLTRREFSNNRPFATPVIFSPLDISCEYPISSQKAYEIASDHWGFKSGMYEGAAGTLIVNKIVILEKPDGDTPYYRICWQMEGYRNHVIDSPYSLLPKSVLSHEEIYVDASTGTVRECTETEVD